MPPFGQHLIVETAEDRLTPMLSATIEGVVHDAARTGTLRSPALQQELVHLVDAYLTAGKPGKSIGLRNSHDNEKPVICRATTCAILSPSPARPTGMRLTTPAAISGLSIRREAQGVAARQTFYPGRTFASMPVQNLQCVG